MNIKRAAETIYWQMHMKNKMLEDLIIFMGGEQKN